MNPVRVRFAPSPTGDPHIGGARTAPSIGFSRGTMAALLSSALRIRIRRNTEAAIAAIYDGLHWLGLLIGTKDPQAGGYSA